MSRARRDPYEEDSPLQSVTPLIAEPIASAPTSPAVESPVLPSKNRGRSRRSFRDASGAAVVPVAVPAAATLPRVEPPVEETEERIGYHTRIEDLPENERPRERLLAHGAEVLSNTELFAILVRSGTEKVSALELAAHLVARFDGLRGIARATVEELTAVVGVGDVVAAQIKAGIELGKRLAALSDEGRPRISSPRDVYTLLAPQLMTEKREHLMALLLDARGGVQRTKTVAIGDLTSAIMNPREVFSEAVRHGVASMILVHNHPSGDPSPSPDDISVTRRISEAGRILDIELLDHVVLGDGRWVSLKEQGLL